MFDGAHGVCLLQCFVFGAADAGKSSLLQGLVRKHGQPGGTKSEPEDSGSPRQAPASNIAINDISVMRGNRQREGTAVLFTCMQYLYLSHSSYSLAMYLTDRVVLHPCNKVVDDCTSAVNGAFGADPHKHHLHVSELHHALMQEVHLTLTALRYPMPVLQ